MSSWFDLPLSTLNALPHWVEETGLFFKTGGRITLVILLAWLISRLARRVVRLLRQRITQNLEDRESIKRAETLSRVIRYLITVVVTLTAGMLILAELGISIAPILGAAGVVGLAIGFGAQSLVKDYFTGFFLLLEDQVRQGDVVTLGTHTGTVEVMTLRYIRLRDYDGYVHYIPNNTVTNVINMSRDYAYAVINVGVSYSANLAEALRVMRQVATELRADPVYAPWIQADLEIAGVENLSDVAVMLRARIQVETQEQQKVRREYLYRLKLAFDQAGIDIPTSPAA